MHSPLGSLRFPVSRRGFTLVEILATVALIAVLASVAYAVLAPAKVAVVDTKLRTDVVRLNQIISMYLASGGSLEGVTAAQEVIDKLKTTRTEADAKRQVGGLTGRGVDVRLALREQTLAERASTSPRAVWNSTTHRFDIVTATGIAGIADFVLDDNLLTVERPPETRERSTLLHSETNGWVWSAGSNAPSTALDPSEATLTPQENVFDPTVAPSSLPGSGGP
jgi:prepilin-type N-terminal cleavage/methylation domain-containing protein